MYVDFNDMYVKNEIFKQGISNAENVLTQMV